MVLLALGLACTDGGPEPESWELAEIEPSFEIHAGYEHQPERERLVDPSSQPRLELVARDLDPELGLCPYEVEARGFPAIRADGGTLVEVSISGPANADFEDEQQMEVTWLDADATRIDRVYARADERPLDGACDEAIAATHERVAAINTKLAKHSWRPLERLDAYYSAPGFSWQQEEESGWAEDEVLTSLPGAERPVEVFYRHGRFIARIRGVRVLQDSSRPHWRQPDSEFCVSDAQIHEIEFDRATGLALVRYNYSSPSCLCDERVYSDRLELSAELLAALEQRMAAESDP